MDLSTIKKRLECGMYSDPWEYVEDVWLMFDNAWLYNRKTSRVYRYCTKVMLLFRFFLFLCHNFSFSQILKSFRKCSRQRLILSCSRWGIAVDGNTHLILKHFAATGSNCVQFHGMQNITRTKTGQLLFFKH